MRSGGLPDASAMPTVLPSLAVNELDPMDDQP
jgi:hypothetical protein